MPSSQARGSNGRERRMQREERKAMTEQTPDAPAQDKPCIHTLETGKHEWNCFHWVHQAHAPFSYPQCPSCGWIDLDLMVKEAGLVKVAPGTYERIEDSSPTLERVEGSEVARALGAEEFVPDAPGGERAQDEPMIPLSLVLEIIRTEEELDGPMPAENLFVAQEIGPEQHARLVVRGTKRSIERRILAAASPRPAEPEPPKVEQEAFTATELREMATIAAGMHADESLTRAGYGTVAAMLNYAASHLEKEIPVWNIAQACGPDSPFEYDQGDLVVVPYDDLYDLVHPHSAQPKADTGTLEARIEKALEGLPAVYSTRGDFFLVDWLLLRDALTELRKRQEEIAELRQSVEQLVDDVRALTAAAEARASSPDRRALVEKCREKERAYARAAAHHNDPQVGFANICKWFADELEASLTGTGEQK